LIQDNWFEDRNGRCNPNLIQDNCLGIQLRNAIKLDSRQFVWGFNWEMQPNLIQDNYRCEDSNERCNLNLSSKQF
jgi:hypothetical protein